MLRFVLAILCPPACVLMCGRPVQALLNLLLCLLMWIPGVIHAFMVLSDWKATHRGSPSA